MHLLRTVAIAGTCLGLLTATPVASQPQPKPGASEPVRSNWTKHHRVVIQVSQNDPAVMNMALNNAENLVKYYKDKGEKVDIEFVAYGAGLTMMRSDTSPVKERIAAISSSMKNITFSGCNNTLTNQSKQESKGITLLPEARLVPTGIARVVELEEQGWSYVRP